MQSISRIPHPTHRPFLNQPRSCRRVSVFHRKRSLGIGRRTLIRMHSSSEKTPQVIAIGEALFDMLANDYDVPREQVTSWTPKAGGAPCNVIAGVARFGIRGALITTIGNDVLGDQLVDLLKEVGVMIDYVQRRSEPTRDVYVTRTSQGERSFVGFGNDNKSFSDCFIDPDLLPENAIRATDVLVTGTSMLAFEKSGQALQKAVSLAKEGNSCVFMDVNWRPIFFDHPETVKPMILDFVHKADIIKLTDEEAEWLFGVDAQTALQNPHTVCEKLKTCKGMLITAGAFGSAFCFRTSSGLHSGFVPAFPVDVVDTTGAGDAFSSGFIYKMIKTGGLENLLASPESIDSAVEFATGSGGFTASASGAIEGQPKSPADVFQLIEAYQS